ncbi:MAG: aminotransferase class V-fold PLP-dependent enzyme [Hyphomonas sp.]
MRIGETLYFDYQAATPLDPRVGHVMREAEVHLFANPHAADHVLGWRAAAAISEAARQIADLLGLDGDDVTFTSGASEANAMVFHAARRLAGDTGRTEILIGEGDHSSILNEAGASELLVRMIPLDQEGVPDMVALSQMISERTAIVSLIGVSNETGAITDLDTAAKLCATSGAIFHADLSQALLTLNVDMFEAGLSFATISSHKIYGPKGIGALVATPQAAKWISPVVLGGGQQNGRRGGTLPTELCVGFGEACSILASEGGAERMRVAALRDAFVAKLETLRVARLIGSRTSRHPGNALMHFPGINAGDLLSRVQPRLAASSQSACNSGSIEPSRIIQAMGHSRAVAVECVRFSLGRYSDASQVDEAVECLLSALEQTAL